MSCVCPKDTTPLGVEKINSDGWMSCFFADFERGSANKRLKSQRLNIKKAQLMLALAEEAQQMNKEIDDVRVKTQRREDVVVNADRPLFVVRDQLRVVDDVEREEKQAGSVVDHGQERDVDAKQPQGEDRRAEGDEDEDGGGEVGPEACEVTLRRPSEDCQAQKHNGGEACRKQDAVPSECGREEAQRNGHGSRE
eukprot:CAMPEP_0194757942 /NCGR_PEP_ID=MMETSP0323_2-20130528/11334_1 /TAXON_ID=2866 ORGANISM="Crypthecodinium cohnii, Strain Seligo" /NCGR_SAMPLE_ID=MMETSP0323_2 /ASSEMBLY_ACC=CAM_ASM_000346 /LENGTH=194 /DNA_ID=CAMNT_0039678083 /DNA_START=89 /DNA_END=674 /DNA_ORIENTATION=-